MPFYKALEYVLNTANGRIRRADWLDKYYVKRSVINGEVHLQLVRIGSFTKEVIEGGMYNPRENDIVARDWEIIPMESYM